MEGQPSFQWPEILPALDLPSMLAQSAEMFGIQGGEDNGAESDGYSSDSDGDETPPEQQPEPPIPTQATPISPTHTAATSSATHVPPETSSRPKVAAGARKAPDPRRSQIAQEREQTKRAQKEAESRAAVEEQQQQQAAKSKDQESTRKAEIKLVIDKLDCLGLTMGDLVCHFFDPANQCDRWGGFWKNEAYFDEFMACITTRKNATPSGRERAHRWAIDHVKRTVHSEAQQVTTSQVLQSRHLPIDEDFVFQFRFKELQRQLTDLCPVMTEVAESFATSTAQRRRMNRSGQAEAAAAKLKKLKVITTTLLSLLREYNQYNNRFQQILALFMYASGLQRQCFSILSSLGVVVTYTSLVRTEPRRIRQKESDGDQPPATSKRRRLGLLPELCMCMRAKACRYAAEEVTAITYDNIDFVSRVGEQTIGHKDMQENGTCATLFRVPGVAKEDLDLSKYWEQLLSAPPFELDDLVLSAEEFRLEHTSLIQTALGIVVSYGGEYFAQYKKLLDAELPDSTPAGVYELCPLPAMNISEGSVDGNIDVFDKIVEELSGDKEPRKPDQVKITLADQLSLAHCRKGITWRIGNEDPVSSMAEVATGPGLFHVEMAIIALLLECFWGLPGSEANPASLWVHNTLLGRKHIVLTSPPPFRTALDLSMVSLYSRVLATLPLAAGAKDLESYARTLAELDGPNPKDRKRSWARLKSDVEKQLDLYANRKVAARLRREREDAAATQTAVEADDSAPPPSGSANPPPPAVGDMVFEAAVLFFDMSLRVKNLVEAIKRGDSSRVVPILKTLALAFRGTRHTKYAYEMIVFLHNYIHVWPVPLRNAIMKAWLVNTSGKPNSSKPADLMQEHLNLQIKTIYKAQCSNQSWEWLSMIAPCVNVLRRIAREFHTTLGDRQGTKHSTVSIGDDIRALVENLADNHVYEIRPGRVLDEHDSPPKDVISEGYQRLVYGSNRTIDKFNKYFKSLQRRFQVPPVSSMIPQPSSDQTSAPRPTASGSSGFDGIRDSDRGLDDVDDPADTEADESEEDNAEALFDWDRWMEDEDIDGIGYSDEDEFVDEESESDNEI